MAERPTLGDLLDVSASQASARQRGPVPAAVVAYDAASQTAEVRPLVSPQGQQLPPLPRVPILFPRSSTASITWTLAAGDTVWLIIPEADCSAWYARGVEGAATTQRRYDLADAVAIPTGATLDGALAADAYAADALVLASGDIRLGSSAASDYVALASLVLAELQTIKTAYDTHTHSGVTTGGGVSGPPAVPMPAPSSPAATRVKGE